MGPETAEAKAQRQIQQLCGYLVSSGLTIGALYTDEAHWFVRFNAETDVLEVSPCILSSQTSPITLVAALLYVGSLAIESTRQPSVANGGAPPGFPCQPLGPPLGQGTPPPTEQLSNMAESSGNGNRGSSTEASQPGTLRLLFALGRGGSAEVWECSLDGRQGHFAIKLFSRYAEDDIGISLNTANHEASVYNHLSSLQGKFIPRLESSGVLTNQPGDTFAYVLTTQHGIPLSELREPLNPDQESSVLQGLAAIHGLGVLHG